MSEDKAKEIILSVTSFKTDGNKKFTSSRRFQVNKEAMKDFTAKQKRDLVMAVVIELASSFYSLAKTFGIEPDELEQFIEDKKLITSTRDVSQLEGVDLDKIVDDLLGDDNDTTEDI